jgi:hypothetical protein
MWTIRNFEANWIDQILRWNCLLRHVIEGKIEGRGDEEEDVSSYWKTLSKREYRATGN